MGGGRGGIVFLAGMRWGEEGAAAGIVERRNVLWTVSLGGWENRVLYRVGEAHEREYLGVEGVV